MSRALALLALVSLLPLPAAADAWVWRDETGAEVFTDDPSLVPDAQRHTLRRMGEALAEDDGDDESGGWYSGGDGDPQARDESSQAAQLRARQRQSLARTLDELGAELATVERERLHADNEFRRFKVGGRIGAADRAAAAKARVDALDRRLAELRGELARVEAALALAE